MRTLKKFADSTAQWACYRSLLATHRERCVAPFSPRKLLILGVDIFFLFFIFFFNSHIPAVSHRLHGRWSPNVAQLDERHIVRGLATVRLQETSGAEKGEHGELERQCHFENSPDPALRRDWLAVALSDAGVALRGWHGFVASRRVSIECFFALARKEESKTKKKHSLMDRNNRACTCCDAAKCFT